MIWIWELLTEFYHCGIKLQLQLIIAASADLTGVCGLSASSLVIFSIFGLNKDLLNLCKTPNSTAVFGVP